MPALPDLPPRRLEAESNARSGLDPETFRDSYRSVGILGGGTAGYLSALFLQARLPHLEVTLLESAAIPTIGVGEATVPAFLYDLHVQLGIDIVDFHRAVEPTWKQGIKFEWGRPGGYFHAPFDWAEPGLGILGSLRHEGSINAMTIQSLLMEHEKTPLVFADDDFHSFLPQTSFAYHLDNVRLVRFLSDLARARGVRRVECRIAEAQLDERGEVACLIAEDGRRFAFDLYIDCSGFVSFLLEKTLKVPYHSFASSLSTDRALCFTAPHGGAIKPFTTAKTMDHGWCWVIPQRDRDHNGYVFRSACCDDRQAEAEIHAVFPQARDFRAIPFRSGRHAECWRGNVVAIGNAYAFVEPLESSGLVMIEQALRLLTACFPGDRRDGTARRLLNRVMANQWDALRWFLAVHFKFNRQRDTAFWRQARADTDVSGVELLLALYRERAPLSLRGRPFLDALGFIGGNIPIYGLGGFDCVLLGQEVPCNLMRPARDDGSWRARRAVIEAWLPAHLSHAEALEVVEARPELLRAVIADEDGWIHHHGPALRGP